MNQTKGNALITGGAKGIGRAAAIRLAQSGFNIGINYAGSKEKALETCRECEKYGVKASAFQADVSDGEQVQNMLEEFVKEFGSIEVLVNNAGITKDNIILRMSEKDFEDVINTNLKGVFNCAKKAVSYMLKQRYGRIINISSIVALRGNAGQVNYAASKAGIIGLTKSLAKELASKKITVNAVAPGMIKTDMTDKMNEKAHEYMLSTIPCARMGEPEEVAEAIAFFASPQSAYITGQVLAADGGMAM